MTNEVLDRAAGYATCQILANAGGALVGAGAWSLAAGGAGAVPLALGSLSLLGAGFACQPIDVGDAVQPGQLDGCGQVSDGGRAELEAKSGTAADWSLWSSEQEFKQIKAISKTSFRYDAQSGKFEAKCECKTISGGTLTARYLDSSQVACENFKWRLNILEGACVNNSDDPAPIPPDAFDPITYNDEPTGCTFNVQLLGFVEQVSGGTQDPVYVISGANESRAGGGVIGGCNFSPTVYYGGSGGGGGFGGGDGAPPFPYIPGSDDDGRPKWLDTLEKVAVGAAGAAIGNVTADLIQDLFAEKYPEILYRAVSVCEKDAQGEPVSEVVEVPIPALKAPDAQLARLDAIVELLQAHKNFKQPICNEKPQLEGDWVTLRFESDEPSPNSNRAIRKLLRYRSKSGAELGAITDYWRGFTWTAGPVSVQHTDAWWGTPQVWAVSADEGKRVLRHVAGEAGIDPDQVGRWVISGSRNPRYGVSLPVRFAQLDGGPWVTQRDVASGPPLINR